MCSCANKGTFKRKEKNWKKRRKLFYFKTLILTNNVKQAIRIDRRRDWMVKTMDQRWTTLVSNYLKVNDSGKNCKNQR